MAQLPSKERVYSQPNTGDSKGNIFATWNIDLEKNSGKMGVSNPMKKTFDSTDDATLDGYFAKILKYGLSYWAVSDEMYKTSINDDPTLTASWSQDATLNTPDFGNTSTDAVVFDGLLLTMDSAGGSAPDTGDIRSFDGTTWASWWVTTLGQAKLDVSETFAFEVASDGNFYTTDGGNLIHRVTPAGAVSYAGTDAGTLDFSATTHIFTCMESNSNRLWIGTENPDGEAIVIEWDMGSQSISANRLHKVGHSRVNAIAIWNDTPIAILGDGSAKYFNGVSFVEFENKLRFPKTDEKLQDGWLHKNGWAIIDNLPHFLVAPRLDTSDAGSVQLSTQNWQFPAGIYCLEPKIGIYCKYAIGSGASTDYGQLGVYNTGALFAKELENTKFLASYDHGESAVPILVHEERANTLDQRAIISTTQFESGKEVWEKVETLHKKLASGDELRIYYRQFDRATNVLDGTWADTTHFHSTDSISGVTKGDLVMVKIGNGAGTLTRVAETSSSATVNIVTVEDANTLVSAEDAGIIEIINFRKVGVIDNTTLDWHDMSIPSLTKGRKIQLLIEFRQGAGNINELDSVIIN